MKGGSRRPHARRWRRWPWALLGAFLITRFVMVILAGDPDWYTGDGLPATPYVYQSRDWALQVVALHETPYAGAPIEYPPGLLPFILVPAWVLRVARIPYLPTFVLLMIVVDALGLLGTWRLSIRWGSRLGPWVWVVGLAVLGPMVFLRLDLVPAVATIWSLQRVAAAAPGQAGAFLGFGVLAKIYPAFLLPGAAVLVRPFRRFMSGTLIAIVAGLLPFAFVLGPMIRSVGGFHLGRGIQIESVWGNGFIVARSFGYEAEVGQAFGSWDIVEGAGAVPELLSTVLSIAAVVWLTWWASRLPSDRSGRTLAVIWFATISCLLVTGSVLSPQYLIWSIALGAAAACAIGAISRRTMVALGIATLLTHVGFPFLFAGLIEAEPVSVVVLTGRNAALALVALSAIVDVRHLVEEPLPDLGPLADADVAPADPGGVG